MLIAKTNLSCLSETVRPKLQTTKPNFSTQILSKHKALFTHQQKNLSTNVIFNNNSTFAQRKSVKPFTNFFNARAFANNSSDDNIAGNSKDTTTGKPNQKYSFKNPVNKDGTTALHADGTIVGEALKAHTIDVTKLAEDGKLDPVVGRDKEIRRTIQVLSRRTKNNPVLIGEPGVGKTAILEGLAQRIIANEVPESIKNKRVLSLDLPGMIAGTKYRGDFEARMKGLLSDLSVMNDVILFIDEVHQLVRAGATEGGSMDASNMLKPMLARGELHCIGATTLKEYRLYIEKDQALARRFQPVLVSEPTVDDTISILRGLKERYEIHHGVTFQDASLVAAAKLADRYITDRFLPDKAIDLIDEAASKLRLQQESKPENIENIEREITILKIEQEALRKDTEPEAMERKKKITEMITEKQSIADSLNKKWQEEKAILSITKDVKERLEAARTEYVLAERRGDLSRAGELRFGVIPDLEHRLQEVQNSGTISMLNEAVTPDDVATVVSRMTGVPLSNLLLTEKEKLLEMENHLSKQVIGQPEAIQAISNAVRISRAGLHTHERPLGSFLLLGPTGVGKTQLCRTLAEFLFDSPNSLIRIDMSEYQERHSTSRLIGAPPGYVGYDEGGTLTEAVRRQPYSIILFDEFEKAHREISNLLLQMLDAGRLTDGQGRTVDFRNTIIILTSNLGAHHLASLPPGVSSQSVKTEILDEVKHHFPPEFINRLDDIIMFNRLSRENMDGIVDIQLKQLEFLLHEKKIKMNVDRNARTLLADLGYDPAYGARPLKRVIQKEVINPLATAVLDNTISDGDNIDITVKDGKIFCSVGNEELSSSPFDLDD